MATMDKRIAEYRVSFFNYLTCMALHPAITIDSPINGQTDACKHSWKTNDTDAKARRRYYFSKQHMALLGCKLTSAGDSH